MSINSFKLWFESEKKEMKENSISCEDKVKLLDSYISFLQDEKKLLLRNSKSNFITDFFDKLDKLSNKDKVQLRKAFELSIVNRSLDVETAVFWKIIPFRLSENDREFYYSIALLYGVLGFKRGKNSFSTVAKKVLDSNSSKIKFEVLLKSETYLDFFINLNSIIYRMKSENLSFDFISFISDIRCIYSNDEKLSKKVKIKWMEDFYN